MLRDRPKFEHQCDRCLCLTQSEQRIEHLCRPTWQDLGDIQLDGVDTKDYPDFADAFISYAVFAHTGIELSDEELDWVNETYACEINQLAHEEVF